METKIQWNRGRDMYSEGVIFVGEKHEKQAELEKGVIFDLEVVVR